MLLNRWHSLPCGTGRRPNRGLRRHVSSAEGAEAVRQARRRGQAVQAKTCVHYLFLDDDVYDRPDGELWICSPPIRSQEHQHVGDKTPSAAVL